MTRRVISNLVTCFFLVHFIGACAILVPSHHTTEEYTPFFAAASAGDLVEIKKEVTAHPELVNATEWDKATALHDAVGQNHGDVAAFLLEKGAPINASTKDGLTAIHMAAQNGNIPIIRLLISRGAALNAVDAKGWTPLDRAIKWGHPEAATTLQKCGGHLGR